jgi:hypothetical protein
VKILGATSDGYIVEIKRGELSRLRHFDGHGYAEAKVGEEYDLHALYGSTATVTNAAGVLRETAEHLRAAAEKLEVKAGP